MSLALVARVNDYSVSQPERETSGIWLRTCTFRTALCLTRYAIGSREQAVEEKDTHHNTNAAKQKQTLQIEAVSSCFMHATRLAYGIDHVRFLYAKLHDETTVQIAPAVEAAHTHSCIYAIQDQLAQLAGGTI